MLIFLCIESTNRLNKGIRELKCRMNSSKLMYEKGRNSYIRIQFSKVIENYC